MDGKLWDLKPTVGIGELNFGRDRTIIRSMLGEPDSIIRKSTNAENTTDIYPSYHVYYSASDKLKAIEFFGKDMKVCLNSQQLFPGTLSTARQILPDLEDCFGSFISKTDSIGINAEDDRILSILVGCKDYYKNITSVRLE